MEIPAKTVSVVQLVALIEARQFPIGVDCADPLAQRLYDAMSVLMCQASIAARQASIARRYINIAMSEMGNNQGGYYQMKKCLEEMNAQGSGENADVVLCQQYTIEVADTLARLGSVEELAEALDYLASRIGAEDTLANTSDYLEWSLNLSMNTGCELSDSDALIIKNAASALRDLNEFVPAVQGVSS